MSAAFPKQAHTAVYHSLGKPEEVVEIKQVDLPEVLGKTQIMVKFLAANVNPSDLLTIQGKYAAKPDLPAYPGSEGVAEVIKVGDEVKEVAVGDWVVGGGGNTWRTHFVAEVRNFIPVKKTAGIEFTAGLVVNPCTAYRMIKDFMPAGKNVLIQNGANSSVGLYVIQIAKHFGVRTINVVRKRDEAAKHKELEDYLKTLGADLIVTDDVAADAEALNSAIQKAGLEAPSLAIDCVSGKSASAIMKVIANDGFFVNYGRMSPENVEVQVSDLVFRGITMKGFWLSRYLKTAPIQDKIPMFMEIIELASKGKLQNQFEKFSFSKELSTALKRAQEPKRTSKVILIFD